jgi:hypothetical protein
MKSLLILFTLILISPQFAEAGFWLQPSIHYATDTDDNTNYENAASHYSFVLGATFGKKANWVVGQSVVSWARTEGSDTTDPANEISMLELGPRIMYLFGKDRNFYISGTYNFYAKGTRTIAGDEAEIDGSSILGSFGVQMKGSKKFYLGFSINYHATSISKSTVDNTSEDVTNSYSRIYPAIDLSFRFK